MVRIVLLFVAMTVASVAALVQQVQARGVVADNEQAVSIVKNSLLASGKWFKIKVDTTGVYKLTYDELLKIGLAEPKNARIYSYGGRQLPFYCSSDIPDDLNEIPVAMETNGDGSFDRGDYLMFYVEGPVTLDYDADKQTFSHSKHCYSDDIYLFLSSDFGAGKRMEKQTDMQSPEVQTDTYDSYRYVDNDKLNLINSGRRWYDKKLSINTPDSALFVFPNLVFDEQVTINVCAAGRKPPENWSTYFDFRYNGRSVAQKSISQSYNLYRYAEYVECPFKINASSTHISLNYRLCSNVWQSEGYIDKIGVVARERLYYDGNRQLNFRDSRTIGSESVRFIIRCNGIVPQVWDVTNPLVPKIVGVTTDGSAAGFVTNTGGTLHEFVAFDSQNLKSPTISGDGLGVVDNQDLHGASTPDMVIVCNENLMEQAENLANLHRIYDDYEVQVVTQQQIFNEFSCGTPDVSAIRNYARMLYQRGGKFKYLLLFGKGSYDNKNLNGRSDNLILTFQSENGEDEDESYVCDDFFAMLEDGEGELSGTLDIGVGRLPVTTENEAQQVVEKIKKYLTSSNFGSWRNTICFVADDEENGDFVSNAEGLSALVNSISPEYNISKIYLDAYGQVSGSSGATYPDATAALKRQLSFGTAITHYIGHGGPQRIAHETILKQKDIMEMTNVDRLTVFVTASCEVGRYDNPDVISFGEKLVTNPVGAAIAALTTTRVVYNSENYKLCQNLYSQKLTSDLRLGDMMAYAKNATGIESGFNIRKFALLGDPALRLVHPANNNLFVTRINNKSVSASLSDTIHAIDTVIIEGYACDVEGNVLSGDGILYMTVFDKAATLSTRGNDKTSPIVDFEANTNVLFQGKASITDGFFNFSFIMPKDINFSYGQGRISLYAVVDSAELTGCSDAIVIGGTPADAKITDFDGPQIVLFHTDTIFREGGIVGSNPVFIAQLFDESGINTTGNGIGHDITAVLDGDPATTIVLNSFYEGYIDQYNSGEVRFRIDGLEDGEHTLTFKAWDIYNNLSEAEISFVVVNGDSPQLGNVYNYPNPATTDTYFVVNHNQTDGDVDFVITIADPVGRKIAEIRDSRGVGESSVIHWRCQKTGKPLPNGVYIYTVEVRGRSGKCTKSGKMVIARQ